MKLLTKQLFKLNDKNKWKPLDFFLTLCYTIFRVTKSRKSGGFHLIDIVVKQKTLFIKADYNKNIVTFMRSRPVRVWNVQSRMWELPESDLDLFLQNIEGLEYKIKYEDSQNTDNLPEWYVFKTTPFQHQREGICYGLRNSKFLLADEQGLGKTKTTLDLSVILKKEEQLKHVLIITCVNSLKYNWRMEVSKHTDETGYILGTRFTKKGNEYIGSNEDRLKDVINLENNDNYFIITNIETIRYNKKVQVPLKTKKNGVQRFKNKTIFPIVEELQKHIKQGNISMIIVDEIHRCKDSNSLQGKALSALTCDHQIALTGTPLMNNPMDLYIILKWLGFEKHSFMSFQNHYCIKGGFGQHQIIGYKNLPELQSIVDKHMLRRLKQDVLDLPEKIYINDYVEMSKTQIKLYEDVLNSIVNDLDRIKLSPNPLTMLIRLRQVTGNPSLVTSKKVDNPKFERMLEIVEDVVEAGEKCLVFSNWTNVINPAFDFLSKFNPALYTGENVKQRESEKQRFMTDPSCKVLLGTIDAMGTGLTLTAATNVIFLDEPWNRAKKDQCEDRVHRIGTSKSPNIHTLICKGTIDERINNIVQRKGKMSDIIIDKEEDIYKNPKILNYLLSIT